MDLDFRCWALDFGFWTWVFQVNVSTKHKVLGFWALDLGLWTLHLGLWNRDFEFEILDLGHRALAFGL